MGAVEGPRREAQDVLLLPLHFAHGPVLPLQLLLLPLSHALPGTGRGHHCHQAGARGDEAGDGPGLTWASLTSTLPRLLSSFMICRMAIFTSTCTRFCTSVTRRMLPGTGGQGDTGDTGGRGGDAGDTHKPRSSLVERCSTACLSPRRCTSAASTERCFRTASSRNWDLGNGGEWGKMGRKRGKGGENEKRGGKEGEERGERDRKGRTKRGRKGGRKEKGRKAGERKKEEKEGEMKKGEKGEERRGKGRREKEGKKRKKRGKGEKEEVRR